jgi:hypothetical protein
MSLKSDLLSLKVVSLSEMLNIPSLNQFINEEGLFIPDERLIVSSKIMLDQLVRWTKGLKTIKEDK